jgi:hypothetical protein
MEPFLVPNNLYRDRLSCGMISTAQYLAEGTFPEAVHNLVTVTEMITVDDEIVTAVIVIPVIVRRPVRMGRFLLATSPNVIYGRVIKDLLPLVLGQMLSLTALEDSFKGVNK